MGQLVGDPSAALLNQRTLRSPPTTGPRAGRAEEGAKAAYDYALSHEDKRGDTLKRTFGRMDKDEIKESVKDWDKEAAKYGQKPCSSSSTCTERAAGGPKLSGDRRNEIELLAMGVARNDRGERAMVERMRVDQQMRDAGILGFIAGKITGDWDRMEASRDRMERLMGLRTALSTKWARPGKGNFDENGKFKPPPGSSKASSSLR